MYEQPVGTLASHQIAVLISQGQLMGAANENIQPASLDLTLSTLCVEQKHARLPRVGQSIVDMPCISSIMHLSGRTLLRRGHIYRALCNEHVKLASSVSAAANGKSTAGRLDIMARLLCDAATEYNRVPAGYCGPLWLELTPRTFDICVREGDSLAQLRFFSGSMVRDKKPMTLHVDLSNEPAGYVGKCGGIVYYGRRDHNYKLYWQHLSTSGGEAVLQPGKFYILQTLEHVNIDQYHAAEIEPINTKYGDFRLHYAGFVDPGFNGRLVLEVRPFEVPIVLRHGQAIGVMHQEAMSQVPPELYGERNNYQNQTLKLAKQFC